MVEAKSVAQRPQWMRLTITRHKHRPTLPKLAAKRTALLHPLFLFIVVWACVALLYAMHLSRLLIYTSSDVLNVVAVILGTYVITVCAVLTGRWFLVKRFPAKPCIVPVKSSVLEFRLKRWFRIWMAATLLEIIVSGGVPIIWLIEGSSKTYFDFGIHSLHGLLDALLLSLSLCSMGLFVRDGNRRHLIVPIFAVAWSAIVITRNLMIVNLLQCSLIWLRVRAVRTTTLITLAIVGFATLLAFGYIGDFRTGAEAFRKLAQPTSNYPEWLPSGFLWFYIYLATPINNLVNTTHSITPLYSILFPHTTSLLFPSVIRTSVYPASILGTGTGDLVTQAFNVSTAFSGPYQDFGMAGIVLFTALIGYLAAVYWARVGFKNALIYTVIAQCLLMTVFYNHFFYLPIISQIAWIYFLCRKGPRHLVDIR